MQGWRACLASIYWIIFDILFLTVTDCITNGWQYPSTRWPQRASLHILTIFHRHASIHVLRRSISPLFLSHHRRVESRKAMYNRIARNGSLLRPKHRRRAASHRPQTSTQRWQEGELARKRLRLWDEFYLEFLQAGHRGSAECRGCGWVALEECQRFLQV